MDVQKIMASLEAKHPGEKEYLQAVHEVLESVHDVYNQHPEFAKAKIIERIVFVCQFFVHTVHIAYLTASYPYVACRHVGIRTYVFPQFEHEGLAEAHDFRIRLASRIEV